MLSSLFFLASALASLAASIPVESDVQLTGAGGPAAGSAACRILAAKYPGKTFWPGTGSYTTESSSTFEEFVRCFNLLILNRNLVGNLCTFAKMRIPSQ